MSILTSRHCRASVDVHKTRAGSGEVVNPFGLVRYHLLFVIDIATRCVCIGGITSDPNGNGASTLVHTDRVLAAVLAACPVNCDLADQAVLAGLGRRVGA